MAEERILDKVRKLLAMASDERGNEQERETALRQAYALMTKYQIDEALLGKPAADDPRGQFAQDGWAIPWCRSIRSAIAKLFMCSYFYQKINATRATHTYVGRESNATTAHLMSEWIIASLLREADKRYGHRLTPGGRSFGEGCADMLWRRINQMIAEAEKPAMQQEGVINVSSSGDASTSASRALVLVSLRKSEQEENEEWIEREVPDLKKGKTRNTKVDLAAYTNGRAHAQTINLSKQLGGQSSAKKLT